MSERQVVLSVIMPAYNRAKVLRKAIKSFLDQSLQRSAYELIIVNDGSPDETKAVVSEFVLRCSNIVYCEQENKGPAAARNLGLRHARGRFVLFTGDDIIATHGLLRAHLECLQAYPGCAVLGFTNWSPGIEVTPFMRFLMERGHQFNYNGLRDGQTCPWGLFYTSNVSLERRWLEHDVFDERMPYPVWEDSELGYRLYKKGLRIVFARKAAAYHEHFITEEEFNRKTMQSGIVRIHFYRKYPELITLLYRVSVTPLALLMVKTLFMVRGVFRLVRVMHIYWTIGLYYSVIIGIHRGKRLYGD